MPRKRPAMLGRHMQRSFRHLPGGFQNLGFEDQRLRRYKVLLSAQTGIVSTSSFTYHT